MKHKEIKVSRIAPRTSKAKNNKKKHMSPFYITHRKSTDKKAVKINKDELIGVVNKVTNKLIDTDELPSTFKIDMQFMTQNGRFINNTIPVDINKYDDLEGYIFEYLEDYMKSKASDIVADIYDTIITYSYYTV